MRVMRGAPSPSEAPATAQVLDVRERLDRLDWGAIERGLWERGYATEPGVLRPVECETLVRLYVDDARFRKTIDMAPLRFGLGEYRYFAYPLPTIVEALRVHAYPLLAPIANRWMKALGERARYPADLARFLARCRRAGQKKPTPLLLRYEAGGYNCLHQDLYGPLAFPLQVTCVLSQVGVDYAGGEILLVEQRPRAQSRGAVIILARGEAVIFPNRHRPVKGARGWFRVTVRHGVSRLHSGERLSLGIIFHDAE